jgi:hypothetical protein
MKYQKEILIFFALLDAFLFGKSLTGINFSADQFLLNQIKSIFIISLAVSPFGLTFQKKWGYILYYVQFPFRYMFMALSFGFLTCLVPATPSFIKLTIIVAMILEIVRLILTVKIYLNNNGCIHRTASTPS